MSMVAIIVWYPS